MTRNEAIERLDQKVMYLRGKIADTNTPEHQRYWLERDHQAMMLAVQALIYTEQMAEYEASQFPV